MNLGSIKDRISPFLVFTYFCQLQILIRHYIPILINHVPLKQSSGPKILHNTNIKFSPQYDFIFIAQMDERASSLHYFYCKKLLFKNLEASVSPEPVRKQLH